MTNKLFACFGYGSLVNRQTLRTEYLGCCRARLSGWRRHWQSRGSTIPPAAGDDIALLSVHRHEESQIDGLLILEPGQNLGALDRREERYERVRVDRGQLTLLRNGDGGDDFDLPADLFVYVGLPQAEPAAPAMLLQSYLDAVLAGFLAEFGAPGLDRFFASTIGFARPLIADRGKPRYPRPVELSAEIAREFDRRLAAAGAHANAAISA